MSQAHFERRFPSPTARLFAALAVLSLAACQPSADPSASASGSTSGTPAAAPQAAREYLVKGLVNGVAADGREIRIHHEPVPEFVGIDGQAEPMDAMIMPFPVSDKALVAGLAPGDRVSFTFRVDWEGQRPLDVIRIEKLPPETRLSFEKGLP